MWTIPVKSLEDFTIFCKNEKETWKFEQRKSLVL